MPIQMRSSQELWLRLSCLLEVSLLIPWDDTFLSQGHVVHFISAVQVGGGEELRSISKFSFCQNYYLCIQGCKNGPVHAPIIWEALPIVLCDSNILMCYRFTCAMHMVPFPFFIFCALSLSLWCASIRLMWHWHIFCVLGPYVVIELLAACCGALQVRCLCVLGLSLLLSCTRALRIGSLSRRILFILVRVCRTALTFLFASIKIHILKKHSLFNLQLEWRGVSIAAWQIVWVADLFSVFW